MDIGKHQLARDFVGQDFQAKRADELKRLASSLQQVIADQGATGQAGATQQYVTSPPTPLLGAQAECLRSGLMELNQSLSCLRFRLFGDGSQPKDNPPGIDTPVGSLQALLSEAYTVLIQANLQVGTMLERT